VTSCQEAGVFGVVPGVIGCTQATEAIKLLLGLGKTLVGRLLILLDALNMEFLEVPVKQNLR
jgi:adenylyltransferase/sulfurtransferase